VRTVVMNEPQICEVVLALYLCCMRVKEVDV
jgi:hypothetical protein